MRLIMNSAVRFAGLDSSLPVSAKLLVSSNARANNGHMNWYVFGALQQEHQ
jgi:hypothetical protein